MRRKGHYKEVVRGTMISLRLTQEESLRLKMGALRERTSVSRLMRRGVAGLIAGTPSAEATLAATAVTAPTGTLPEAAETASTAAPLAVQSAVITATGTTTEAAPVAAAVAQAV
jgi:hypothetical protein